MAVQSPILGNAGMRNLTYPLRRRDIYWITFALMLGETVAPAACPLGAY